MTARKKKATAVERKKTRSPFHPIEQSQVVREPHQPAALMEFITTLEGELEYREAMLEFQNEWCDHPKSKQEAISTRYCPQAASYNHVLRCNECGILRSRAGRAGIRG